jgi:hypothetical protein
MLASIHATAFRSRSGLLAMATSASPCCAATHAPKEVNKLAAK